MNTPAHLLVGVALFARRSAPRSGRWAAFGSLLPDASLYVLAGVSLFLLQISPSRVFDELYFSTAWQSVFSVDNSFVIWAAVLGCALWLGSLPGIAFAAAGLIHIATDFALHHDDARAHFWPISNWVFESPVSYWDSQHHAAAVAPVTLLAVLVSAFVIWRRWPAWGIRLLVVLACAAEIWVLRQWLLFF